jgi:prepilin-type N-terminal cleavage/methylation domain-containing protein
LSEAFEMPRKPRPNGFTLVELLMTVALIGVLAVLATPPIMRATQERELSNATQSVLNMVEYARVQAAARNRAYRLRPAVTGGTQGSGSFELIEGLTSACRNFLTPAPDGTVALTVRTLDLGREHPGVRVVSLAPIDLESAPLCFKPDGRVYQVRNDSTPVIVPSTSDLAGGDARIRLQRFNARGRGEGAIRVIRVPFNGMARVGVE